MIWGGVSWDATTDLDFIRGTLNSDKYLEILEEFVVPYAPFIGDQFIPMQDNARPHVARRVTEYLNETHINKMDWPARSPDLNPIEHVWDYLKRKRKDRNQAPITLLELRAAIQEEWQRIPQDFIKTLIESIPNRLQEVIRNRGGNTRY